LTPYVHSPLICCHLKSMLGLSQRSAHSVLYRWTRPASDSAQPWLNWRWRWHSVTSYQHNDKFFFLARHLPELQEMSNVSPRSPVLILLISSPIVQFIIWRLLSDLSNVQPAANSKHLGIFSIYSLPASWLTGLTHSSNGLYIYVWKSEKIGFGSRANLRHLQHLEPSPHTDEISMTSSDCVQHPEPLP
jgi:hypothetical protein